MASKTNPPAIAPPSSWSYWATGYVKLEAQAVGGSATPVGVQRKDGAVARARPAAVGARTRAVHLLEVGLAELAHERPPEAGRAPGDAVCIAEAVGVDLAEGRGVAVACERIARRDAVGVGRAIAARAGRSAGSRRRACRGAGAAGAHRSPRSHSRRRRCRAGRRRSRRAPRRGRNASTPMLCSCDGAATRITSREVPLKLLHAGFGGRHSVGRSGGRLECFPEPLVGGGEPDELDVVAVKRVRTTKRGRWNAKPSNARDTARSPARALHGEIEIGRKEMLEWIR